MRRALCLALLITSPGCVWVEAWQEDRRIAALEEELADLNGKQIAVREVRVEALEARLGVLESFARSNTSELEGAQRVLVESWRGHRATMEQRIKRAKLPAELADVLRATQKSLGKQTTEQRFIAALAAGDLSVVGDALSGWEQRTDYVLPPEELDAVDEAQSCTCTRRAMRYRCAGFPRRSAEWLVCAPQDNKKSGDAWLFHRDPAATQRWSLGQRGREQLAVERVLPNGLTLIAGERVAPGDAGDGAGKSPDVRSRWLEAWVLDAHRAKKEASLPLEVGDKKGRLVYADLNGDQQVEVIHRFGPRLTVLEVDPLRRALKLWERDQICERLNGLKNAELEPVAAACKIKKKESPAK